MGHMPWTEELPNGLYRAVWRDQDGRKRSRSGFVQESAAKRFAGEQESKEVRGESAYRGRGMTWGEWCPVWLQLRRVEPSTAKHDAARIERWLAPKWSKQRLAKIRRSDVQRWVNDLAAEDISPSTVRRIFHLFSASMKAAIRAGDLAANPCQTVDLPTAAPGHENYLTRDEFDEILFHLSGPYRTAAILLAGTGMRFGEMSGLHWSRVDFYTEAITITETWDPTAKQIKAYPKSKKPRTVPMPDFLVPELARLDAGKGKCGLPHAKGSRCDSRLVLSTINGLPLDANTMRNQHWAPALRLANAGHFRLHDLRHSYASWLRQAGIDLETVQELLGHGSILTSARYSHMGSSQTPRVLAALNNQPQP